jgi:hypothetical protein
MPAATHNHEQHKLAIAAALRELEHALDRFVRALAHDTGPVNAEGARSDADARRRICAAYAAIDYGQDDEVNRSLTCLGLAGVTSAVIDRAEAVNEAKSYLKEVCAPLQNARIRMPVKDGQGGRVVKSLPLVRVILRELQRSDLNLLAAYRRIPILTGRVARVAYTRALTRAVYRKSRGEIATMLEASNRATAAADLALLQRLPARETHLALAKERYTNIRANVWFHGLDARNRGRAVAAAVRGRRQRWRGSLSVRGGGDTTAGPPAQRQARRRSVPRVAAGVSVSVRASRRRFAATSGLHPSPACRRSMAGLPLAEEVTP